MNFNLAKTSSKWNLSPEEVIYILYLWKENLRLDFPSDYKKSLVAKGYLDLNLELTEQAHKLTSELIESERFKTNVRSVTDQNFKKWWETFPVHDGHAHYSPTRTMRVEREVCYKLYKKALKETNAEDLLGALKRDIHNLRINSLSRNELTFLPNSDNYLKKERYRMYLDNSQTEEHVSNIRNNQRFKIL